MRKILSLPYSEQQELLYTCAVLSYYDVHFGLIQSQDQMSAALQYGNKYDIIAQDYQNIYATVFPTNGPPQKP